MEHISYNIWIKIQTRNLTQLFTENKKFYLKYFFLQKDETFQHQNTVLEKHNSMKFCW